MAEDRPAGPPADNPAEQTAGTHAATPGGGGAWRWLLPALAFVAGVALGAVVVGAGLAGDDDLRASGAVASPTPEPEDDADPSASGDVVVRVPGACLEAADGAEQAARQVDDVADAVRAFDARRLQELVDRFQQLQPEVQRLADRCRELAGGRLQDGTFVTPEPDAGTGPVPTPSA